MTKSDQDDKMLDALFATAKAGEEPVVSPDLVARILADAEALQPTFSPLTKRGENRSSVVSQMLRALGGWPPLTGLAAATVAGVWIGFAATPEVLTRGIAGLAGADSAETAETDVYLAYLDTTYSYGLEE